MNKIQQFEPITHMQTKPAAVLAKLQAGPVILAQRSKATAVLVSVAQWDQHAEQLAKLQRRVRDMELLLEAKRSEARGAPMISHDELKQLMEAKRAQEMSLHVAA